MDDFANSYQAEDYNAANFAEGDYNVRIKSIETKVAQSSGNPMIVATLTAQGAIFDFRFNLVKNEHFNANATKFFDCFKIPRGNFEYPRWVVWVGEAHIAKGKTKDNGKSYWEIQYLIVAPAVGSAQVARAPAPPAQNHPPAPAKSDDGFTDDIPF